MPLPSYDIVTVTVSGGVGFTGFFATAGVAITTIARTATRARTVVHR
jgi:hypothetical protein